MRGCVLPSVSFLMTVDKWVNPLFIQCQVPLHLHQLNSQNEFKTKIIKVYSPNVIFVSRLQSQKKIFPSQLSDKTLTSFIKFQTNKNVIKNLLPVTLFSSCGANPLSRAATRGYGATLTWKPLPQSSGWMYLMDVVLVPTLREPWGQSRHLPSESCASASVYHVSA